MNIVVRQLERENASHQLEMRLLEERLVCARL